MWKMYGTKMYSKAALTDEQDDLAINQFDYRKDRRKKHNKQTKSM